MIKREKFRKITEIFPQKNPKHFPVGFARQVTVTALATGGLVNF